MFNILLWSCRLFIQTPLRRFSLFGVLAKRHRCLCVCSSRYTDVVIMYSYLLTNKYIYIYKGRTESVVSLLHTSKEAFAEGLRKTKKILSHDGRSLGH
jgi:hypothetical protein